MGVEGYGRRIYSSADLYPVGHPERRLYERGGFDVLNRRKRLPSQNGFYVRSDSTTSYLLTNNVTTGTSWVDNGWRVTAQSVATYDQWIATSVSNTISITNTASVIRVNYNTVWPAWVDEANPAAYPMDEDDRAAYLARQTVRNEERQIATARARELLLLWLDEGQKREMEAHRFFTIVGSEGRRYQIHHGRSGNVYQVDECSRPLKQLCAHPADDVPDEDTMLAQKLMIEVDEPAFLALANIHQRWNYPAAA